VLHQHGAVRNRVLGDRQRNGFRIRLAAPKENWVDQTRTENNPDASHFSLANRTSLDKNRKKKDFIT
jgi:hypothetical protein